MGPAGYVYWVPNVKKINGLKWHSYSPRGTNSLLEALCYTQNHSN